MEREAHDVGKAVSELSIIWRGLMGMHLSGPLTSHRPTALTTALGSQRLSANVTKAPPGVVPHVAIDRSHNSVLTGAASQPPLALDGPDAHQTVSTPPTAEAWKGLPESPISCTTPPSKKSSV